MEQLSNVTASKRETAGGLVLGIIGVGAFSFSLPATKLAVEQLDPWFVAFARAAVAAALAVVYLAAVRARLPRRDQLPALALVAGGVVVGFPLFTSLALTVSDSAHGAVVIALLPAATALAAVLLAGERPGIVFWCAALAGLAVVVAFTLAESGGGFTVADGFLLAATAACAVGYAQGGVLSRELGGARTISWALVLSAPLTLPVALILTATTEPAAGATSWAGFAYVSAVSMFLGFFAWYAALARGGVARIGQVQLTQPLLTLGWSALALGEHVGSGTLLAALAVLASVVVTQRAPVARFVDDQLPVAGRWRRGAEVREVEREDRQVVALGAGHDGGVGEAEVEVGEAGVDLDGAAQQAGGEERDGVLADRDRVQEEPCGVRADAGAEQLIDFHEHRVGYEEIASELGDQCGGQSVGVIAAVGGRDQWARVCDDLQPVVTGARR
jgi:drug/metabolite transporter (DMT)-like permease